MNKIAMTIIKKLAQKGELDDVLYFEGAPMALPRGITSVLSELTHKGKDWEAEGRFEIKINNIWLSGTWSQKPNKRGTIIHFDRRWIHRCH